MSSETISSTVCGDGPAVLLEVGVVDVELGLTRAALQRKVPVGDRGAVQVDLAAVGEILGPDPAVVLPHEGCRPAQPLPRAGAHALDRTRRR